MPYPDDTSLGGPAAPVTQESKLDPATQFQIARWLAWKEQRGADAGLPLTDANRQHYQQRHVDLAAQQGQHVTQPTNADIEASRVPMPNHVMLNMMRQFNLMPQDAARLYEKLYYGRWDATPGGDPRQQPEDAGTVVRRTADAQAERADVHRKVDFIRSRQGSLEPLAGHREGQ